MKLTKNNFLKDPTKFLDREILVVLVGIPGSGKTTWAKKTFGSGVYKERAISTDLYIEIKAEKLNKTYTELFTKYIKEAEKVMEAKFNGLVRKKKLIIWDQTNVTKKKRKKILNKIPNNYKTFVFVFDVDEDTVNERLEDRANETGKSIPITVMNTMRRSFTTPTKDEGFDNVWINK
jgi:predicted kinase